jgi:hypothetical protein
VLMASAMTNSTSAAVSNPIEHGGNAVNCGQLVTDVGSATVRASGSAFLHDVFRADLLASGRDVTLRNT